MRKSILLNRKTALLATISMTLLLSSPIGALALSNDSRSSTSISSTNNNELFDYKKLIPTKLAVSEKEEDTLESAIAFGILETVSRVIVDQDSEWANLFKNGKLDIKKVIPILDVDDNLAEVMLIYEKGYLIVDAENGTIIQYTYGEVNQDYFNKSDKIYVNGSEHMSIIDGNIIDGNYKDKDFNAIKNELKKMTIKKDKSPNKKWDKMDKELRKSLIQGYGANEGNSRRNFITDPAAWLSNYYGSGYSIVYNKGYSRNVAEINQDLSQYPEANVCALISTLEILSYYQSPQITSTQLATAYTAMKNSSYFSSSNGVYWNDNDQLFKIASQSIGWPTQSTADDPEDYVNTNNYNYIYNKLYQIGPGYLSMTQAPYGAHTVTFKGVKSYIVSWWSAQGAYYSNFEDFVTINDHWATTSGDAYLSIQGGNATWYFTTIVPN
jgi:hypothetical protein